MNSAGASIGANGVQQNDTSNSGAAKAYNPAIGVTTSTSNAKKFIIIGLGLIAVIVVVVLLINSKTE